MQQRFIKLAGITKYKTILTALFLGLYAFIATPVQFWHEHNYETSTASEQSSAEKHPVSVSKSTGNIADTNCQVCTHHYSIYLDVALMRIEMPVKAFQSIEQDYFFSIPSSPYRHFANKGPPALS